MLQDISFEEYLSLTDKNNYIFIDVRSPAEYLDGHIPNAFNVPLFDNEERAKIGTTYKQKGEEAARKLGVEIVSPKIPNYIATIDNILNLDKNKNLIFYCWRGGMRSKTLATFSDLYGFSTYRLIGGYRAYREYIVEKLNNHHFIKVPFFVIHGKTGVGKTKILKKLKENGYPVIDLEEIAGHKGSAFGAIGMNPVNQKIFDSELFAELIRLKESPYIIIEAESKRIGKILLPEAIVYPKEHGINILIEADNEVRINNLLADYINSTTTNDVSPLIEMAIDRLKKRFDPQIYLQFKEELKKRNFAKIAELLIIHYYDPRYQHATEQYDGDFLVINSNSIEEAINKLIIFIEEKIRLVALS